MEECKPLAPGAVVEAARPTLEMELPYRTYKLVYADGSTVETYG